MLVDTNNIPFTQTSSNLLTEQGISLEIARLDLLHPIVSGNKIFKLFHFLKAALASSHKTLLTFGGAYSNHLAATAFACKELGLKSIGIVRGERPASLSHTLQQCLQCEMDLHFIPRSDYKNIQTSFFEGNLHRQFGSFVLVPEGGYHPLGAAGAALIMDAIKGKNATHICTAVGTATTLAGLIKGSSHEEIIAIPVLKGFNDLEERLQFLTGEYAPPRLKIFPDYHFGGYAKHTPELISFMNEFYETHGVPTDFVYTAKMMYAVDELLRKGYFPRGSRIVCVHTGGLQGNETIRKLIIE